MNQLEQTYLEGFLDKAKKNNLSVDSIVKAALFGFGKKEPPPANEQVEGMFENVGAANTRLARRARPIPALANQNLQSLSHTIEGFSYPGAIAKRILWGFLGAAAGAGIGAGVTHSLNSSLPSQELWGKAKRNAAIGAALGGLLGYSREKYKQREEYQTPITNYNVLRAWAPDAATSIDRVAARKLYRLNQLEESNPLVGRLVGD